MQNFATVDIRFQKNNKYQSNVLTERPNQFIDYLIDPSFQGVNRMFVLSFEDNDHLKSYKRYFLPTVEVKDNNFCE